MAQQITFKAYIARKFRAAEAVGKPLELHLGDSFAIIKELHVDFMVVDATHEDGVSEIVLFYDKLPMVIGFVE